jgi:hypothetical protein
MMRLLSRGQSLRLQSAAQILPALKKLNQQASVRARRSIESRPMTTIAPDELPNRAFELAYFLHRERQTATVIATRALNKLEVAAASQGKRLYYRLTGRLTGGSDSRKARSKVSMGEPHLLQRLVYVESEEYERRKEAAARGSQAHPGTTPARTSDLVVYFIKHLVRITTKRNSFYVTLVSAACFTTTPPLKRWSFTTWSSRIPNACTMIITIGHGKACC